MYFFRIAALAAALFALACGDTTAPDPAFGGRVVVYEGGGEPKPKPEEPPVQPEPDPVPGTMELQANGTFQPIVDGLCRVRVYGWATGGPITVTGVEIQSERGGPITRLPGTVIRDGRRYVVDVTLPTPEPTSYVVTVLRDTEGSPFGYRRLCR